MRPFTIAISGAITAVDVSTLAELIADEAAFANTEVHYQGVPIPSYSALVDAIARERQARHQRADDQRLRAAIRAKVGDSAGDLMSLLGTTSDGTQLLLHWFCQLVQGLSAATSVAEVKAAAAPFAAHAQTLLDKVANGEVQLTSDTKGEAVVLDDIARRATHVATILQHANLARSE